MTRENLIKAIYDNDESWSCTNCPHTMEEENPKEVCWKCAEKLLSEYDKQIRAEALLKFSKRLLDYDTQITKEDIIDELCFFIDRDDVEKWLKEQK